MKRFLPALFRRSRIDAEICSRDTCIIRRRKVFYAVPNAARVTTVYN
jgi:hypothetical protein